MEKQPVQQQPLAQPTTSGHELVSAAVLPEPDVTVFADWLDGELEKLVARWIHLAAPNAARASGRRTRCP